jgi:YD repeat-containing protein
LAFFTNKRIPENKAGSITKHQVDFQYGLNPANQQVSVTNADGNYTVHEYDLLRQVTAATHRWNIGGSGTDAQLGHPIY